jgi:hypothetical protein
MKDGDKYHYHLLSYVDQIPTTSIGYVFAVGQHFHKIILRYRSVGNTFTFLSMKTYLAYNFKFEFGMKKVLTTLSLAFICQAIFAQASQNPWFDTPESRFAKVDDVRHIVPEKYRSLTLDLEQLKALLDEAPMRFSAEAEAGQPSLTIPMPDGSMQAFQVVEAPVMHPDLAARYPYIRSFAGWSKADGTAYLRCGYTQNGFHAMVLSAQHSTVYIDQYRKGDDRHYISYFKKDYANPHQFECLVDEAMAKRATNPQSLIRNQW